MKIFSFPDKTHALFLQFKALIFTGPICVYEAKTNAKRAILQ